MQKLLNKSKKNNQASAPKKADVKIVDVTKVLKATESPVQTPETIVFQTPWIKYVVGFTTTQARATPQLRGKRMICVCGKEYCMFGPFVERWD